jgi:mannitol/fructose-specific phosphotransferase system IIA component (Ntr-type)
MQLSDFIMPEDIHLALAARSRTDLFPELASLLRLGAPTEAAVRALLEKREAMGSTGIGRGIAVPHCRTSLVAKLRVIYARSPGGIEFGSIDGVPVEHFFLLLAPPVEVANEYLPVLGRIARLAKEADTPELLRAVASPEAFLAFLATKAV